MDAFVPPAPAKVVLQRVSWPSNEKLNEKLFVRAIIFVSLSLSHCALDCRQAP